MLQDVGKLQGGGSPRAGQSVLGFRSGAWLPAADVLARRGQLELFGSYLCIYQDRLMPVGHFS